ncbi:transcription initiation factor IIB family protein [Salinigranum halophilum]|uniref:transcription initiation factor IIB family protein n=1 Tax=Salinigranum halophilum TaxID=2565931 RepID=UPI0010A84EDF|nr:transcription initiation factor IIB family protein [Salinigranum halophilum]
MSSNNAIGQEASEQIDERPRTWAVGREQRTERCDECGGRLVQESIETVCEQCGLVVGEDAIRRAMSPSLHKQGEVGSGPVEWSLERTTSLRVDKGLHTTFFLSSDGYGNALTKAQKDKFGRLRMRHKRFQMESKRAIRLNEGLRDIQMIVGNLGLPSVVAADAAALLKRASEERLPGGRMGWEALAAGAVYVATSQSGFRRTTEEVAVHAKTSHERLCAAARKLRCELGLVSEVPPTQPWAVDAVVEVLGEQKGLSLDVCLELRRVGEFLLDIADEACIGPGTTRVTMAAAAVYAADRLTEGKAVTQQDVADAASAVVPTSKSKVSGYSRDVAGAYNGRYGTRAVTDVLTGRLA